MTMEKKIIPPLLQGFEPATFQSRLQSPGGALPLNYPAVPNGENIKNATRLIFKNRSVIMSHRFWKNSTGSY